MSLLFSRYRPAPISFYSPLSSNAMAGASNAGPTTMQSQPFQYQSAGPVTNSHQYSGIRTGIDVDSPTGHQIYNGDAQQQQYGLFGNPTQATFAQAANTWGDDLLDPLLQAEASDNFFFTGSTFFAEL
jgi:hypothetical protein